MGIEILPDCRTRSGKGAVPEPTFAGAYAVPIACASCAKPGGFVPEKYTTFAYYLCDDCFAKYGHLLGPDQVAMPDPVFWELVKQAQIEEYGRALSSEEVEMKLMEPNSLESKLARGRKALTPGNLIPGR